MVSVVYSAVRLCASKQPQNANCTHGIEARFAIFRKHQVCVLAHRATVVPCTLE